MTAVPHTCLFTGELLSEATLEEHTIPLSVGGRLRSKIVSSSSFNQRAGNTVDQSFASTYAFIYNRLGPVLRTEHHAPEYPITIFDDHGKFMARAGARISRGITVLACDVITRKPAMIVGEIGRVQKFIKDQIGLDPSKANLTYQMATEEPFCCGPSSPVLDPRFEASVLKSILLTFDHVLRSDLRRFTRDPALESVRKAVHDSIMNDTVGSPGISKFVLGMQERKLKIIQELRAKIPIPVSPFEHFLVASSSPVTRTLDVAWHIGQIETWAFRLSDDWKGEPFVCAVVMGILRGTNTSGPHWLWGESPLFEETRLRSTHFDRPTEEEMLARAQKVIEHRQRAYQAASEYVEYHCDDHVKDCIINEAVAFCRGSKPAFVRDGILQKLRRQYQTKMSSPREAEIFDRIIATHPIPTSLANDVIDVDDLEAAGTNWPEWLRWYRDILRELTESLGPPGEIRNGPMTIRTLPIHVG